MITTNPVHLIAASIAMAGAIAIAFGKANLGIAGATFALFLMYAHRVIVYGP